MRFTILVPLFSISLYAQDPLLQWMDRIAQQQLTQRESVIAGIRDTAGAELRKRLVRAKLLENMGGLPDFRGPLNARITGRFTNASYTIEKVILESLPKYFVTANLYRPNQPGRYPAVLMSAGHTMLGKVENHIMAANLAAKGFVALAYDPVGLGERMQAYDRRIGRGIAGCCANEHLQAGAQSILIGQSVARYFIWDAMRAIDYLVSRPDVDQDRIGAAGCSGGGCLTTYIAALDPRVKAAAPACFINTLRLLFTGPFPDSEMSMPRFLVSGLDHADFLEVTATIPWLILATEGDFFTPAGVRPVYDEVRQWYRLYGAEEKVEMFVAPGPHGTPRETRERMYGWMIRWLNGGRGDAREQEIPLFPDHALQVTTSGQVEDEPGSRKLHQVIREDFDKRRQPQGIPELLAELRRLQVPSDNRPLVSKTLEEQKGRLRISLESEPGVTIGGTLSVPSTPGRKPALLLVKDRSTAALAETAAAKGIVVLELEPRDSPSAYDNRPYLGNWLTNARADSIGRNLPAMRAHDILRGVDLLSRRDDVDAGSIRAAARDVKGIWLLLAAAMDPRIGKLWLDHTPYSLRAALDNAINTNLFDAMIPGFLLHWDLPDLVRAMGTRPVLWTDPANWMGQTVPGAGSGFRYRYSGQSDEVFLAELLR
ncbi:MAG: acetylxylan esterase [Acidobacteriia bacterium]|nr:acetylxylan esterase [Terriglobia bacterium]